MLELRESDWIDDWYVLQEDKRDVSDASVEGTLEEWIKIAEAIRAETKESFRRCAVARVIGGYEFWSPRNSMGDYHFATDAEAEALAGSIFNQIGNGAGI